ncbi:MAG: LptA/OstA family protein [Hyphomicrobiaceae bacterium]
MATTIDPRRLRDRPSGLAPSGRGPSGTGHEAGHERARAFAAARRHSAMVRTLRFALPTLAVGLLGIYGVTTWRLAALRASGVTLEDIRISNDHLMMANPKYAGAGKDGSRHAVRARSAETDLVSQKIVKLTAIEGELTQLSGTTIDLTATRGTYDQETGVLELHEQIDVRSSDGMTAKLTTATVLTKENRIVSSEPITATTASGSIRARTMEMETQRRLATFTGDVAVRMTPPATPDPMLPTKEKPATPPLGPSFSSNEPVDITSDRLIVDDEKRTAMFRANVVARQGAATLAAPELDAVYAGRSALPGGGGTDAAMDAAASRLMHLKARGGIVITRDADRATATTLHYDAEAQRTVLTGPVDMTSGIDRRATSSTAEIDHKADRIMLEGAVVLYQGRNILRGERLAVDRANGRARLDSPPVGARSAGRISVLLYRTDQPASRARPSAAPAETVDGGVIGAFRADPNAPIDIEAATLDFDETRRNAHFTGNVVAQQGEFVIRTPSLTAMFQGQTSLLTAAAKGSNAAGASNLKKVEARNGVVVVGKDGQKVTGDWADFDPIGNFATVGGRVVVNQGKNVVEGSKLIMDLTSGRTRFETGGAETVATAPAPESAVPCVAGQTCTSKPRVRAIFYPKDTKRPPAVRDRAAPAPAAPEAAAGQAPAPRGPSQSSWQSSTTRASEPGASQ